MDRNYKTLGFSYVDIEGYFKTDRQYCEPDWPMTATTLSDAAKECSDTNCHMFFDSRNGKSFRACEKTASIATFPWYILYIPQGNKLYTML